MNEDETYNANIALLALARATESDPAEILEAMIAAGLITRDESERIMGEV
mgnify:CR=1 FL=1